MPQNLYITKMGSMSRHLLAIAGSICVGLGALGIFLPVLPTTPFLLLAVGCYAKSSNRLYVWLLNHKYLGRYVRAFKVHRAIPLKGKIVAVVLIWSTIGSSVIFFVPYLAAKIVMLLIAAGVTYYILSFPTLKQ